MIVQSSLKDLIHSRVPSKENVYSVIFYIYLFSDCQVHHVLFKVHTFKDLSFKSSKENVYDFFYFCFCIQRYCQSIVVVCCSNLFLIYVSFVHLCCCLCTPSCLPCFHTCSWVYVQRIFQKRLFARNCNKYSCMHRHVQPLIK